MDVDALDAAQERDGVAAVLRRPPRGGARDAAAHVPARVRAAISSGVRARAPAHEVALATAHALLLDAGFVLRTVNGAPAAAGTTAATGGGAAPTAASMPAAAVLPTDWAGSGFASLGYAHARQRGASALVLELKGVPMGGATLLLHAMLTAARAPALLSAPIGLAEYTRGAAAADALPNELPRQAVLCRLLGCTLVHPLLAQLREQVLDPSASGAPIELNM